MENALTPHAEVIYLMNEDSAARREQTKRNEM